MFAQGQLLGMQSDLLAVVKTQINDWDKVAERHPHSVFRRNERPQFSEARQNDPYTTNFGEGLPFRTYDRNQRARTTQTINRSMEQPYPTGYTGHVTRVRHVVGQTNGKMVREAINTLTPSTELTAVKPVETPTEWRSVADKDRLVSTQQLSFRPPDYEMELTHERAANALSTRRPIDHNSRFASSALLSYPPPPARAYATPGWSARPTSNIGQPDTYKHINIGHVHQAELPHKLINQANQAASLRASSSSIATS